MNIAPFGYDLALMLPSIGIKPAISSHITEGVGTEFDDIFAVVMSSTLYKKQPPQLREETSTLLNVLVSSTIPKK